MGNCNQKKTENNILIESAYNWNPLSTSEYELWFNRNPTLLSYFESDRPFQMGSSNCLSLAYAVKVEKRKDYCLFSFCKFRFLKLVKYIILTV